MRKVFKILAWIFALGILIQVYFAGLALFTDAAFWSEHEMFGGYLGVLPVVMLLISILAKLPRSIRVQCLALISMIALIFVTAMFSADLKFISALHPVIAVFLFFRTMAIIKQTN